MFRVNSDSAVLILGLRWGMHILKGLAILIAMLTVYFVLATIAYRYSLGYWLIFSVISLPLVIWQTRRAKEYAGVLFLIAVALTFCPLDLTYKRGDMGLRILATSHGSAARSGTLGYGCTVRNTPDRAIVLSF